MAEERQVEALLERVSEGTQPGERLESLEALKHLLSSGPSGVDAFAAMGAPVMCAMLRDDQDNFDLVQGALECLLAAAGGPLEASAAAAEPLQPPYAHVCGAITGDASSLQLLLSMLDSDAPSMADFYVRYTTVQLLSRLVTAAPAVVQGAVLERQQVCKPEAHDRVVRRQECRLHCVNRLEDRHKPAAAGTV